MDSGFYAACTALIAKTDALDVAASNMSNTGTTGFKGQLEFYQSLEANSVGDRLTPLNQAVNNYAVLGGAAVDLRKGEMQKTGNDLDLAVEGLGFFVVQTQAGIRYTRNGSFHTDVDGRLLTGDGDQVMGSQGPLQLPGGSLTFSPDGTVSKDGAVVASMRVASFKPGTSLTAD
jgi:flagellar basal-body rod protein FlgF